MFVWPSGNNFNGTATRRNRNCCSIVRSIDLQVLWAHPLYHDLIVCQTMYRVSLFPLQCNNKDSSHPSHRPCTAAAVWNYIWQAMDGHTVLECTSIHPSVAVLYCDPRQWNILANPRGLVYYFSPLTVTSHPLTHSLSYSSFSWPWLDLSAKDGWTSSGGCYDN